MKSRRLLLVLLFSTTILHSHLSAIGGEPTADEATSTSQPDLAIESSESSESDLVDVTAAEIEKIKRQATEAEQLENETRAEITGICDKAITKLTEAEAFAATTALLRKELEDASSAIESTEDKTASTEPELQSLADLNADEMRARLSVSDQNVSAARERSQKIAAEIERRADRRKALPEELAKCREQLAALKEIVKQPTVDEEPLLTEAKRLHFLARRNLHEKELQSLEQENRTYETTSRRWLARHDEAEKQLQLAINSHKVIHDLVAEAQRHEAEKQAREARQAAFSVYPAVKEAAAKNAELAERNQKLVNKIQQIQNRLAEAQELGLTMQKRLESVTKHATAASNTPAIGAMLRSQQDQLPELAPYNDGLRNRPLEISQMGLDTYEWGSQRRTILHLDKAVEAAVQEIETTSGKSAPEGIAAELRRILESRADILAELISNTDDCVSRLEELDAAESEIVAATEQLELLIAEHVMWVRSAPVLSLEEFDYVKNFWADVQGRVGQAKELASLLLSDLRTRPAWWDLGVVLFVLLLAGRRRARSVLKSNGEAAAKLSSRLFRPTVDASLATVFLASPVPVVLGFIGWRLFQAGKGLSYAVGWAIVLYAAAYAMLNLVRHASRHGGLGTHHFGWNQHGLAAIHRTCRMLQILALPLLAVAVGVEIAHDGPSASAIGRLSLIPSLLVIGVVCFRLFRPAGAFGQALATESLGFWGDRLARVLVYAITLATLGLAVASVLGYHYAAMQLTRRVFVSCVLVFACLALRSLLMRWLLVTYRRAAMDQALEEERTKLETHGNASSDNAKTDSHSQINLSDINQQAHKLVGVGAGLAFLASMWFIWADALPALGVLNRFQLWESGLVSIDPNAGPTFVTLADLILAIGIFSFTLFAGRNLPGLLEMAVLQKLPLDDGARYATNSLTRYAIMVVGVILGTKQLGIGWHSVQWLIAAMTVGLGFGLQEIFANFVSGIILLFERPARVGDTVTIGEITGTITKIRIRATTILDWDNKELIIPNKEFVTGNLVNWTLTTPNLRLIISVGVAYGSDTRLATELLYQAAKENPNVLDDPRPVVVFNEFGASSLDFQLRLFVSDLTMYRRLRHDLNIAIDDLFKQHNIEIAYPQCDLHIKTMPDILQDSLGTLRPSEASDLNKAAA